MSRPRPPYLLREKTRHGKFVWYVRRSVGPRVRIRGEYGTPEFWAAYEAAVMGSRLERKTITVRPGTLQWLWGSYRETSANWASLSPATRRQRENIMLHVLNESGEVPFSAIKRHHIEQGKDRRHETPAQARNFLDAMRGLFRWAHKLGTIKEDPTFGVENPSRPKTEGFVAWTEEDVAQYETRWPIGTHERVWLDVLLYTGLRRGDAVRLGRQHVRDGVASLKTEKSKFQIEVSIPILPILQVTLDAGPCGDLAFICGKRGRPLTKESFGNNFKVACKAANVIVNKKAAHGLRKIGATRAAENGATVAELEAIFGWQGGAMASLYTRKADRKRLAMNAMKKIARNG